MTAVVREQPTPAVAVQVVLMLAISLWMYGGYAWLTNAVSTDRVSRPLVLLAGMAGFFLVALTVPDAFDGGGLAFGLAYGVVIAVHIGLLSGDDSDPFLSTCRAGGSIQRSDCRCCRYQWRDRR